MIYIASDHAAFEQKLIIVNFLREQGYNVEDLGPDVYEKADDYPDYAFPLAERVVAEKAKGILLCGSGVGVSIAANKVKGARAAYAETKINAVKSREDDDANILVLDAITFDPDKDLPLVKIWLETEFSGAERHIRRLNKVSEYENQS